MLRTAVGHRLAKVQGYLFKAAFLRRVPTFTRLIVENLILCFLQSAVYQTSKYLTGSLNLRFKKILTDLVHANYFKVHQLITFDYALVAAYIFFPLHTFQTWIGSPEYIKDYFPVSCVSIDWHVFSQNKNINGLSCSCWYSWEGYVIYCDNQWLESIDCCKDNS